MPTVVALALLAGALGLLFVGRRRRGTGLPLAGPLGLLLLGAAVGLAVAVEVPRALRSSLWLAAGVAVVYLTACGARTVLRMQLMTGLVVLTGVGVAVASPFLVKWEGVGPGKYFLWPELYRSFPLLTETPLRANSVGGALAVLLAFTVGVLVAPGISPEPRSTVGFRSVVHGFWSWLQHRRFPNQRPETGKQKPVAGASGESAGDLGASSSVMLNRSESVGDPGASSSVMLSRSEASPRSEPAPSRRCFAAAQHDNRRAQHDNRRDRRSGMDLANTPTAVRFLLLGAGLAMAFGLLLTQARNAMVSLLVGLTVVGLLRLPWLVVAALWAALIAVAGLLFRASPMAPWTAYLTNRWPLWERVADLLLLYPLTGVGLDHLPLAIPFARPYFLGGGGDAFTFYQDRILIDHAHNGLLQTWADLGLMGVIGLIWLVAAVATSVWRAGGWPSSPVTLPRGGRGETFGARMGAKWREGRERESAEQVDDKPSVRAFSRRFAAFVIQTSPLPPALQGPALGAAGGLAAFLIQQYGESMLWNDWAGFVLWPLLGLWLAVLRWHRPNPPAPFPRREGGVLPESGTSLSPPLPAAGRGRGWGHALGLLALVLAALLFARPLAARLLINGASLAIQHAALVESGRDAGRPADNLWAYGISGYVMPPWQSATGSASALMSARALGGWATALASSDPDAWHVLGRALYLSGDIERAAAALLRAAELAPNDPYVQFDLGVALDRLGDADGALAAWSAAGAVAYFDAAGRGRLEVRDLAGAARWWEVAGCLDRARASALFRRLAESATDPERAAYWRGRAATPTCERTGSGGGARRFVVRSPASRFRPPYRSAFPADAPESGEWMRLLTRRRAYDTT